MITVKRKFRQVGTVPCEGHYLYQATFADGMKTVWMDSRAYNRLKKTRIIENFT